MGGHTHTHSYLTEELYTHTYYITAFLELRYNLRPLPSSLRRAAGVHPGVGLLQRLHGSDGERAGAGPGRGLPQAQRHPLSLLPPAGEQLVTPLPQGGPRRGAAVH